MKNGKKPKVADRKHIEKFNLNSENWLISKKTNDFWLLVNRINGKTREIPAP